MRRCALPLSQQELAGGAEFFDVIAARRKLIHRTCYAVLPPAFDPVVVARDIATRLDLWRVTLEVAHHKFVKMVSVDIDPIEVAIREIAGRLARRCSMNHDRSDLY